MNTIFLAALIVLKLSWTNNTLFRSAIFSSVERLVLFVSFPSSLSFVWVSRSWFFSISLRLEVSICVRVFSIVWISIFRFLILIFGLIAKLAGKSVMMISVAIPTHFCPSFFPCIKLTSADAPISTVLMPIVGWSHDHVGALKYAFFWIKRCAK